MAFLVYQQAMVHNSTIHTYENGSNHLADIIDLDIKQIAAQSNGYVVIEFEAEGEVIRRRLSLSVQMAQKLLKISTVPIKYDKGAYQEIVLIPTYEIQRTTSYYNILIAAAGLLIAIFVAFLFTRYANRRMKSDDSGVIVERID